MPTYESGTPAEAPTMPAAVARPSARPFPEVEGVSHGFVEVGGLRMHVAEAGAGEPLVMLHGWPQHWYEWRHQIPALAEHYRVICPDLRGFGWTDAPPSGYEKENLAADIVGLLDALGLQRVRLVGHDWGGWVGFLLAMRHPERVERLLALNIPPPWGKPDLRTFAGIWRFWYQGLIASPGLGGWVLRNRPGFVRRLLSGTSGGKRFWSDDELAEFVEPLREPARAHATVQLYRTFLTREFPKVARGAYESLRLTTPTLLLFGTDDFAISTSFLRGYEPYVDDMVLELVPGCGHFIAEERPELVTERALQFFGESA
jgi:pimeloyl-ACP methyl ester carboxylesterase